MHYAVLDWLPVSCIVSSEAKAMEVMIISEFVQLLGHIADHHVLG